MFKNHLYFKIQFLILRFIIGLWQKQYSSGLSRASSNHVPRPWMLLVFSSAFSLILYLETSILYLAYSSPSAFIFLKNIFYWSIVDLQCCIISTKWLNYTNIYILFHILFHYSLYSSLCYTIVCCDLSILYIIAYICKSQSLNTSLPSPPLFLSLSFSIWPCHMACGALVPQLWTKPVASELEAQSLNHWTTREVLFSSLFNSTLYTHPTFYGGICLLAFQE